MRYIFLTLMNVILITGLFSQEINERQKNNRDFSNIKTKLTGKVSDKETGKPVEGAAVQIYSEKDTTKLVKGTASDKEGNFILEEFRPGKYMLRISFIGYNTSVIRNIMVTPMEPEVNVGDVKIKTGDEFMTTEIEVTAEQSLFEMGIDKKVFNVEKDINSQSGSAADVLKNIPSVTIDSDGRISLRGSGNVKILLNGKPSGLLSTDPGAVLEQIPANTIERIEIMNNPSAKFDPEGISGIINIVLKKGKENSQGYNYNLNITAGTKDKYNLSTGLSYRTGKWNLYANYGLRFFHMFPTGNTYRTNYLSDSSYYLKETDDNYMKMLGHLGTAGFDLDLNKNDYLGFSLSYSNRDRNRNQFTLYQNYNQLYEPTLYYNRQNYDNEDEEGLDANLNFKHKFEKRNHELNANIQYSLSREDNVLNITQNLLDFNNNPIGGNPYLENDYTNEKYDFFVFSADYTHPLKEDPDNPARLKSKYDLGLKGTVRQTDENFSVENFDYNSNSFVPNYLLSNDFLYKEQIFAVYGTFENNFKKFGYQVGLRLEQAVTKSEQKTLNQTYDKNYFSWFPSIFLKQGIAKNLDLQLSLTRRINRPNMRVLNPFINYSDPQNIRYGNPDLNPEYINGAELGFVKYFTTISVTSSAFYRITEDVITRYITVDSNGISTMTFKNLDQSKSYGLELIATGSVFKWWFLNGSISYFRTIIDGNLNSTEMNNSGYTWTSKLMSTMTFPDLFDFQFTYFLQGENVTVQGTTEPFHFADITVKKDFLNKRMSLGFRISDVFNTQKFGFNSSEETFSTSFQRKRDSRTFFLTFAYRIGTDDKKMRRQKQNQQEENRDTEEF
ncbi:MAG: TonB-dependent receptor [Ignavibacteria bacterium]|nr:TonB-dependent receptor [Ignavibacteria bacterium]